jgi:hypothetical protein
MAAWGDALGGHEGIRFIAQNLPDFVRRPDQELALLALAVGVLGAVKPPASSSISRAT